MTPETMFSSSRQNSGMVGTALTDDGRAVKSTVSGILTYGLNEMGMNTLPVPSSILKGLY